MYLVSLGSDWINLILNNDSPWIKIETAIEPKFQEYFIEAMAIPHKADSYEELAKVVPLPAPKPKAETGAGDERKHCSRHRRRTLSLRAGPRP